jgi:catechol 2,3-dioxygenase-like lactoylglutathione lyase family enzyme
MFSKIALISVPVGDQEAAKAFYVDVLGCTVMQDNPFPIDAPGTRWIMLELPGVQTRIVLVTWFSQMKPGGLQGLVLTTRDIEAAHRELRRRGLGITAIEEKPWAWEATFTDLDGNGWVLQQNSLLG